jgi:hypothetical protein
MSFYVRPEYLEIIHYYYFSIGIFSFIAAVSFGYSAVYSAIFILLYVGQSSFAWYLSWAMQKRMKEIFVISSWRSGTEHVILTFFVGGLTLFLWYVNAFNERSMVEFMLYINYVIFFFAVIWYAVTKFGIVKTIFNVYDFTLMERAKGLVIKTREKRRDIFTRRIIGDENIKNYKTGSNPEIDDLLLNAWREKSSPRLIKRITEIEMAMCEATVDRLRNWISKTTSQGVVTPRERASIDRYMESLEEYAKSSMDYEKNVISKIKQED